MEDASKFRFFSTTAAPFFKGIANVIYSARTAVSTTAANADALPVGPLSAEEVTRRVAAALDDPPDFGDLNQPGPVFGAPLEKQVPSPDYPVRDLSPFIYSFILTIIIKRIWWQC